TLHPRAASRDRCAATVASPPKESPRTTLLTLPQPLRFPPATRLIISRVSFRSRGERYGCHLFSGMCVCITNPCRMFVVVLRSFVATDPGVVPKGPQPGGRVMSAPLRSNIAGAHVSSAGLRTGGAQRLGRRIV